jgi:hypothetical protein
MAELQPVEPRATEALPLAAEMGRAVEQHIQAAKQHFGMTDREAVAYSEKSLAQSASIEQRVPSSVTFFEMAALAKVAPVRAEQRWEEIGTAARAEIQSGHLAAKATEVHAAGTVWQRQIFLALRGELADAWHPQGGLEWALIDQLALAWSAQLFWHERMMLYARLEASNEAIKLGEGYAPPRVTDAQAVEQAAQMVDRFNRIFMRTLRMLKDPRRHTPAVVVQSAGQVNVAHEQVNVALVD